VLVLRKAILIIRGQCEGQKVFITSLLLVDVDGDEIVVVLKDLTI